MKKSWVYLKRGLLTPEHVQKMGVRLWLYLYMCDSADWPTGTIAHWKDRLAAADLGVPEGTIRDQRTRLATDGYISCKQGQQELHVAITKWVNPREYSGKVYNPPVADADLSTPVEKTEPSPDVSEFHGETHGATHGATHGVTATKASSSSPLTINHNPLSEEGVATLQVLHNLGVDIDTSLKLAHEFPAEKIRQYAEWARAGMVTGAVHSPGWLVKAIRNDWPAPRGVRVEVKRDYVSGAYAEAVEH